VAGFQVATSGRFWVTAKVIGEFTKTEHGFTGKFDTLAVKATITLQPNDDKEKDIHPDYIVLHGTREIGVAWNRVDDWGAYVSISFEEPSLAPGSYRLVKTGAEKAHALLYRKPQYKKAA
jgi:uncharacterized protein (DUF736 family)